MRSVLSSSVENLAWLKAEADKMAHRYCYLGAVALSLALAGCQSTLGWTPGENFLLNIYPEARKDLDKAEQEEKQKELEALLEKKNGNGEKNGNGNGEKKEEEFTPSHMRDNAFLVEEAFNQGKGEVQHISSWVNLWDRFPGGRNRDFTWFYTMELPLGSQLHQFAFTIQMGTLFEKPDNGPAQQSGDLGNSLLTYRYQLLANDDFLWCAPTAGLILPTGDERFGFGEGKLGYFFNLPISRYTEKFDFHFNAGIAVIPDASLPLAGGGKSPPSTLTGYVLGGSVYYKPETYLHFFVELLALWNEEIQELGFIDNTTQVFLNPGVRYAVTQKEGMEWVIGASVPIGLTRDTPEIGVFAYMSVEYDFRNPKKKCNGGY